MSTTDSSLAKRLSPAAGTLGKHEPISPRTSAIQSRLRGAKVTHSVCPYCAIGCGLLVFTKAGKPIAIEGNPESPVNEGRLCPKGANTLQLVANPHRVTTVRYRAPHSDHWEERPLAWAMDRIARLVKEARDRDFVEQNAAGVRVNSLKTVAELGGATLDNEENYLIKKLFTGGLGILPIENQARL
jgi:formate dehydrogenase major subunit